VSYQKLDQYISDVFIGTGEPPVDWLNPEDICRAVYRALTYYQYGLSQSSENQVIKSWSFTPANRTILISGAIDINQPLWVERQVYSGEFESWQFVPSVNLSQLESNRLEGWMRCAFYGENGQMYIRLSYNPQILPYRAHRLYYDPAPLIAQTLQSQTLGTLGTGIPVSFAPMVTLHAIINLIPLMQTKASSSANIPSKELLASWDRLEASSLRELPRLEQQWKSFCFGSRDGQRGRRRKNILGNGGGLGVTGFPGYR
jgi:hypothetical protein